MFKLGRENLSFARVEPPLWALRVQVRNHESRNEYSEGCLMFRYWADLHQFFPRMSGGFFSFGNVENNEQGRRNTWLLPLLTYCKLTALGNVSVTIDFFSDPSLRLSLVESPASSPISRSSLWAIALSSTLSCSFGVFCPDELIGLEC